MPQVLFFPKNFQKSQRRPLGQEFTCTTPLKKAVQYLLNHEAQLRACFEHVPSRIDNNLAEITFKPFKLSASNWLFIGNETAGDRHAVLFTLVQNCRFAGINPEAWLLHVLSQSPAKLKHDPENYLPLSCQHLALSKNA